MKTLAKYELPLLEVFCDLLCIYTLLSDTVASFQSQKETHTSSDCGNESVILSRIRLSFLTLQ